MAQVFTKQARKSVKGVVFAPGKSESGYMIFKLCKNYNGKVRGGIEKTWRCTDNKLTLVQAKAIFEKKLGYKLYEEA